MRVVAVTDSQGSAVAPALLAAALDSGTRPACALKFHFREGLVASAFHFTKSLGQDTRP